MTDLSSAFIKTAGPKNAGDGADVSAVDATTVRSWLNDGGEIAFLDIREAGQFGEGHPFFAIPLPYSRLEKDAPRLVPRRNVRVVLLDDGTPQADSRRRLPVAALAARRLAVLGYTDVAVLAGGAPAWEAAGYTLFKGINLPSKTFGELVEHAYHTPHVSATELARKQRDGEPFALFDGRTVEEFRKMTIPGSSSLPNGELAYRIDALVPSKETPIIINCAGRTRSILGAQTLRNLGLPNPVFALENGTQGWQLAGLKLEHGSDRLYSNQAGVIDEKTAAAARERAQRLAVQFRIATLDADAARDWLADTGRTTYLLDVRTAEEYREDGLRHVTHAPGGQLIQATDLTIGVRGSRLLFVDYDGIRAPVVASWLIQLGYEVALIDSAAARGLEVAASAARGSDSTRGEVQSARRVARIDVLQLQAALQKSGSGKQHLLDIRSSAAFLAGHVPGAQWAVRPRIVAGLVAQAARVEDRIVLLADDALLADSAAHDLIEAGFTHIVVNDEGASAWREAGLLTGSTGATLSEAERIDYLFFVHDRHEGNLVAAQAYLDWETGLLAQCAPDELAVFRLPTF